MSDPFQGQSIPRSILLGAAALVSFALIAGTVGRIYDVAKPEPIVDIVASRDLRFEDRTDGSVAVFDAKTGEELPVIEPGTNGFLRATLRGLARDRRRLGGTPEDAFRVAQRPDGRLTLIDTANGRQVELAAFGATNSGAFQRFLVNPGSQSVTKISAVHQGG